jgi:hypothetical protein
MHSVASFKIIEWWSLKNWQGDTIAVNSSLVAVQGLDIFKWLHYWSREWCCHETALYLSHKPCRICGRQSDCHCFACDCVVIPKQAIIVSWSAEEPPPPWETVALHAVSCVLACPYYYRSVLCRSDETLMLYCSCDLLQTLISCRERLAGVDICPKAVHHHITTVFLP